MDYQHRLGHVLRYLFDPEVEMTESTYTWRFGSALCETSLNGSVVKLIVILLSMLEVQRDHYKLGWLGPTMTRSRVSVKSVHSERLLHFEKLYWTIAKINGKLIQARKTVNLPGRIQEMFQKRYFNVIE